MKEKIKIILIFIIGIMISVVISVETYIKVRPDKKVRYINNKELMSTSDPDYINGVYSSSNTIANILDSNDKTLKFIKMSKQVTIPGNTTTNVTIGKIDCGTGYNYLGVMSYENGYADQWIVSYAEYGTNIVAMVTSKWGSSLTSNLKATVVCYKASDVLEYN